MIYEPVDLNQGRMILSNTVRGQEMQPYETFSRESKIVLIDLEILQLAMHLTIYMSVPGL